MKSNPEFSTALRAYGETCQATPHVLEASATSFRLGLFAQVMIAPPGESLERELNDGDDYPRIPGITIHVARLHLAPEEPCSVVPFDVRRALGVVADTRPALNHPALPPQRWRGIPCQIGKIIVWLRNDCFPTGDQHRWNRYSLTALLPEANPSPPFSTILLGYAFLRRYSCRVITEHGIVSFDTDHATGVARPDPNVDCGLLEID